MRWLARLLPPGRSGRGIERILALTRLKTRAQFQSVLSHATRARTAHFVLHMLPLDAAAGACALVGGADDRTSAAADGAAPKGVFPGGGVWLGAMTPKRWARRAVTRNAIRRQIYAVAGSDGPPPSPHADVAWVVRLRAEFSRKVFVSACSDALKQAVRDELRLLWTRAAA